METHLAALYYYLQVPPLHVFSGQVGILERLLPSWGLPAVKFVSLIPDWSLDERNTELEALRSLAVSVVLTQCSKEVLAQNRAHFDAIASHLLDREALEKSYETWVHTIYALVVSNVQLLGNVTMEHFVKEIVAACPVDVQRWMSEMAPETPPTWNSAAFHYFVAQLREVFMVHFYRMTVDVD